MRTCIPLTKELKKFYNELMGKSIYADEDMEEDDDYQDNSIEIEDFFTPKTRFVRNTQVGLRVSLNESHFESFLFLILDCQQQFNGQVQVDIFTSRSIERRRQNQWKLEKFRHEIPERSRGATRCHQFV